MTGSYIYIENTEESTIKPLELISRYRKGTEYKINIQIWVVFLYIGNEKYENKIKKIILFKIASKKNKVCASNLTKNV